MSKKKQKNKPKKTEITQTKKKPLIPTNHIYWLIGIIAVTIIAYSGSFQNEITNFDDEAYVTENPLIQELSFKNIEKLFSEPYYGGYYPLTLISFALDIKLSGEDPTKMLHFTNLLLHLINLILLWWLTFALFKKINISIIVTLLFGVHTLHVESVAWISERKDVLYTFFYLLSLISYIKYLKIGKPKFYLLAFFLFFFSLLSKTMAVSLVASLFIIDYILGKNLWNKKLLIEKIPFIAFGIFFGLVSIWSQKSLGIISDESQINFFEKIIYACYGFTIYIVKLVIPINLSAFYPYPEVFNWLYLVFILPVAGIIYLIVKYRNKNKILVFGLLFYIFNIVLVLQILQINNFIIADRFTYVASIGIFILLGYGIDQYLIKKSKNKNIVIILISIYVVSLIFMTYTRVDDWKDSETLWSDMIDKHPDRIPKAYYFRGHVYAQKELYNQALQDFDKVIELKPKYYLPMAHHSRATTYANQGKINLALDEIGIAIELDSINLSYYYLRAQIYMNQRRMNEAEYQFDRMVEVQPDNYMSYYYRAMFNSQLQNFDKALIDYDKIIELNPDIAEAYYYRGGLKLQLQRKDEACADFKKADQLGFKEATSMIRNYCNPFN